jgi:hypothetical protein
LGFELDQLNAKEGFDLFTQLIELTEEIIDHCEKDKLKHSLTFSSTYYIYFTDKNVIF